MNLGEPLVYVKPLFPNASTLLSSNGSIQDAFLIQKDKIIIRTSFGSVKLLTLDGKKLPEIAETNSNYTAMSVDESTSVCALADSKGNITFHSFDENKRTFRYKHDVAILHLAIDPHFISSKPVFYFADIYNRIFRYSPSFLGKSITNCGSAQNIVDIYWFLDNIYVITPESLNIYAADSFSLKLSIPLPKQIPGYSTGHTAPYNLSNVTDNATSSVENAECSRSRIIGHSNQPNVLHNVSNSAAYNAENTISSTHVGFYIGQFYYDLSLEKMRWAEVNMNERVSGMFVNDKVTVEVFSNPSRIKCGDFIEQLHIKTCSKASIFQIQESFIMVTEDSMYSIKIRDFEDIFKSLLEKEKFSTCLSSLDSFITKMSSDQRSTVLKLFFSYMLANNMDEALLDFMDRYMEENDFKCLINFLNPHSKLLKRFPLPSFKSYEKCNDFLIHLIESNDFFYMEIFEILNKIPESLLLPLQRAAATSELHSVALMTYHHSNEDHNKAFDIAVRINFPGIFDDFDRYNGESYILSHFDQLYTGYGSAFVDYLISSKISPSIALEKLLRTSEDCGLEYMDKLFTLGYPIPDRFSNDLATNYIKRRHKNTFKFISSSLWFDFSQAKKLSIEYGMYREAAYLSRRTGAVEEGMMIYLEKIRDYEEAIEYAVQANRKTVWKMLQNASYKDPELLQAVLKRLASLHFDPVKYIKKIPNEMLGEMKHVLNALIRDFEIQAEAIKVAESYVNKRVFALLKESALKRKRATKCKLNV